MKHYDIIVIGGGGGLKIARPAADAGHHVAVIEKGALGGTCLNRGCIPSKMLIHPADIAREIKEAKRFQIDVDEDFSVRFAELTGRVTDTVTEDSRNIVKKYATHETLDYYAGQAQFVDNKTVRVNGEQLTADKIYIATGARPRIVDIPGLKDTPFMTSTEALQRNTQPKKLIIIGGGYITAELGHFYGSLGTEIHVISRGHLIQREDKDIVAAFERAFTEQHHVYLHTTTKRVDYEDGEFQVTMSNENGEQTLHADALLLATGVVPNSDTLGLENTDITTDGHGFIQVDDALQTDVAGVYALGDVVGNYMFRHSVNFEGEYLLDTTVTHPRREPISYPPMPHAIFSSPQVAGVGKTEHELQDAGIDYVVGKNTYANSAMGMALRSPDTECVKLLFDAESQKLLGAHIIGKEASTLIHQLVYAMTFDATLSDLLKMIYIHPALSEVVRNACRKARSALTKRKTETKASKMT